VLPVDFINAHFSGRAIRTEKALDDLDEIMRLCRKDMFLLAMNCGFRAKQLFAPQLDMTPLVPYLG